jgi:site-specific recombinase XerD
MTAHFFKGWSMDSIGSARTGASTGPAFERVETTVSEASARFLDHCRVGKSLSAHTLRAYSSDLAHFVAKIGADAGVERVDRDCIREYVRVLVVNSRLKQTTVKRRVATLKVLFRWLEHEEVVRLSVFHRLELSIKLPQRLPRALNRNEMRQLLSCAEAGVEVRRGAARYEALLMQFTVVTLFTTGLRISELISVRLPDVVERDGLIQVRGKGNRERRVYLPGRQAMAILKNYLEARRRLRHETQQLLISAEGRPISVQQIRKRLRLLGERAGLSRRITPHMLRHTAATQLLEAGVDIRVVQRLLGHASIATTQIYTHVSDGALKHRLTQANTLLRLSGKA